MNSQTSDLVAPLSAAAANVPDLRAPSTSHFLGSLFGLLEEHQVRYCVLHGYDRLPYCVSGDLDMAVHPDDFDQIPGVLSDLTGDGYQALQYFEYAVDGHYLVFGWFEGSQLRTIALDFITEHRRGGLILSSGAELIAGRRKRDAFWVPAPKIEFGYLLTKRSFKGLLSRKHAARLRELSNELGRERSEEVARALFGERTGREVVNACAEGRLSSVPPRLAKLLPTMRRRLRLTTLARDGSNPIRYAAADALRVIRRWRSPTGLSVAILGPDGAGKSTLATALPDSVHGAFRRHRSFHLRPMLLGKSKSAAPVTDPHGQAPRSTLVSLLKLVAYVIDYAAGYRVVIRPLVARSGFVIFDRYYQDLLVDPRRFRYSGSAWLVRTLGQVVPNPDLVLLLDAAPAVTLSRKREVEPAEAERQRCSYLSLVEGIPAAHILDAAQSTAHVSDQATRIVVGHLAARFRTQHEQWIAKPRNASKQAAVPTNTPAVSRKECLDRTVAILTAGPSAPQLPQSTDGAAVGRRKLLSRTFAVVPSSKNPRCLLALDSAKTAETSLELCRAYSRRARLLKNLLRLPIRAGGSNLLFGRMDVLSESLAALEELAAETLGVKNPAFAVSIPTPGRNCKATVQIMSREGEILGFLKVALTQGAARRTRHETLTLRRLACYPGFRSHVPEVLFAGNLNGAYVLMQTPLPGGPAGHRLLLPHRRFLRKLHAASRNVRNGEDLVAATGDRWRKLAGEHDSDWLEAGGLALDQAAERLASTSVPCGISHGDFAPWNLRVYGEHLRVFDWESAKWDAPIHWDWFHFETQVQATLGVRFRTPLPGSLPESLRPLFTLYVLNSLCDGYDDGMEAKGLRYRQRLIPRLCGGQLRASLQTWPAHKGAIPLQ